jgi:hypothetical protein
VVPEAKPGLAVGNSTLLLALPAAKTETGVNKTVSQYAFRRIIRLQQGHDVPPAAPVFVPGNALV